MKYQPRPLYKQMLRLRTLFGSETKILQKKTWRDWRRPWRPRKPRHRFFQCTSLKLSFFAYKFKKAQYRERLYLKQNLGFFYGNLSHAWMKKAMRSLEIYGLENATQSCLYRWGLSSQCRSIRGWIRHSKVTTLGSDLPVYYARKATHKTSTALGEVVQIEGRVHQAYLCTTKEAKHVEILSWLMPSKTYPLAYRLGNSKQNAEITKPQFSLYHRHLHMCNDRHHVVYPFPVDFHKLRKFYRHLH